MFRAKKSWEMLPRHFSTRLETSRYQVIEVEEGDTVFSLEIRMKDRQEVLLKKYFSTSLAYAKDFLLAHHDKKVVIYVLASEQDGTHQTILQVSRIFSIADDEDFENLYYECENGKTYLDGIGAVTEVDLRRGEILWEQLT